LAPVSNPLPLGHSVYLSLDAVTEHAPLYSDLVASYRWLDAAHESASEASGILGMNSLNRTHGKLASKRRRQQATLPYPVPPNTLENIIQKNAAMFKDMTMTVTRPNGTKLNAVVVSNTINTVRSNAVYTVVERYCIFTQTQQCFSMKKTSL